MKNIERPEVQKKLAEAFEYVDCKCCPLDDEHCGFEDKTCEEILMEWFHKEHIEPHHWEPWELQAMAHTSKTYFVLKRVNGKCELSADDHEYNDHFPSDINYPSIKDGEIIYIDFELERNGMSR